MTVTYQLRMYRTDRLRAAELRKDPIDREDWELYFIYNTGKEAADNQERLKASADYAGYSFCIIRHDPESLDRNWRTREMKRLFDGTYKLPVGALPKELPVELQSRMTSATWGQFFANRTFADLLLSCNPDHYAHLGQSDETKIAYTEDSRKGERDKQKVVSAMTYLSRHCGSWDQTIQTAFLEAIGGFSLQLQFATTAEEIAAIYMACDDSREVGSCMSHPANAYSTYIEHLGRHVHPTEVYAAGDLQLAYVTDEDTGKIWGRALVWPERKKWGRVYSTNASLFRKALKAAGYESGEDMFALVGARLNYIPLDTGDDIVMPYIDGTHSANWDSETKTLTIAADHATHGNIDASNTSGTACINDEAYMDCDDCDERTHGDDMHYIDTCSRHVCTSCYESEYQYCPDCNETFRTSETIYSDITHDAYCHDCYSERFSCCDNCGTATLTDDMTYHEPTCTYLCPDCLSEAEAEEEAPEEAEEEAPEEAEEEAPEEAEEEAPEEAPAEAQVALTLNFPNMPPVAAASDPIVEIVTEWNGMQAPEGFCFYQPHQPHTPPPHYYSWMCSAMWNRGFPNHPPRSGQYWGWDNSDTENYRYVVPIAAITGQRPAAVPQTQEAIAA